MQTATIEQTRQRDYERYEANRLFEEQTDIAERLGYPIDITIGYEMRGGFAYAMTDTKDRPFHEQTRQAKSLGQLKFTGNQAFEQTRLAHEHDEALMVDALGRGELEGNVLMKLSRIPDAVVRGETDIKGYRRDQLRSFVRLYYRKGDTVQCRLFSLDGNHSAGMSDVGNLLEIDTSIGSEATLARHTILDVPEHEIESFVDGLTSDIKYSYDQAIMEERGVQTHAGSEYKDALEATGIVRQQHILMDKHMQAISSIMALGLSGEAKENLLEMERQRTAAAIKLNSLGAKLESNDGASVTAELETGNYERECATATGMNQAASAVANEKWKYGVCRACLESAMVGPCDVCSSCVDKDNQGIDLMEVRKKALRNRELAKLAAKDATEKTYRHSRGSRMNKQEFAQAKYGTHARVRREVSVGDEYQIIYDSKTGQEIARF